MIGFNKKILPLARLDTTGGPTSTAISRMQFYRDGYKRILRIAVTEAIVILTLVVFLFLVIDLHRPEDFYYAQSESGSAVQMVPYYQPNLSPNAITSWSAQAAAEVMTFGFNDYRRRFQEASRNFTKKGWESFIKGLTTSKLLLTVEQNQQLVAAAPKGPAVIVSEGFEEGRYQWEVDVPLVITYQARAAVRPSVSVIRLLLVEAEQGDSASGVAIEGWTKIQ